MPDGKWIAFLKPDMPARDAARHVLFVRLRVVNDHLQPALTRAEDDPEHVHQLRVGTRRAGEAVRIFRDYLPKKAARRVQKELRQLRGAAGAARDWDVFLLELAERRLAVGPAEYPGLDFLAGYAFQQRTAAQAELRAAGHRLDGDFEPVVADAVTQVRMPKNAAAPTLLIGLARPIVAGELIDLQEALAGDLNDSEHLHQVRITGKRLRYAMEVFVDCFGPAFRDQLYPQIEEVQEILGRINDSRVAIDRLTELSDRLRRNPLAKWEKLSPGIEGLLAFHRERLPADRRLFQDWHEAWRASDPSEILDSVAR